MYKVKRQQFWKYVDYKNLCDKIICSEITYGLQVNDVFGSYIKYVKLNS